jgi:transaldolase
MKFLLDTADLKEIERYAKFIDGVTTNPIILKRNNTDSKTFYSNIRQQVHEVFIQIDSFKDVFTAYNQIVYKIPLMPEKYSLIGELKKRGYRICGTTTYDIFQFQRACDLGCEFCIVLCHKNEDKKFLAKCNLIKEKYKYETKIVAASFREKLEVEKAILIGADFITLRPETMKLCLTNPFLERDIKEYNECCRSNSSKDEV